MLSWSKFREFHEKKYLNETKKNCPAGAVSRLRSVNALHYYLPSQQFSCETKRKNKWTHNYLQRKINCETETFLVTFLYISNLVLSFIHSLTNSIKLLTYWIKICWFSRGQDKAALMPPRIPGTDKPMGAPPPQTRCVVCHRNANFLCSGCQKLYYCTVKCQVSYTYFFIQKLGNASA